MAIIKLTEEKLDIEAALEGTKSCYKHLDIFINTKNIVRFYKTEKGSCVCFYGGFLHVKETPEEILALIKEAENESLSGLQVQMCL